MSAEERAPVVHDVKCWPEFFRATKAGRKDFDIRRDDRDYQVGDTLLLREWVDSAAIYSGDQLERRITYITDFGQREGYVAIGHTALLRASAPVEAVAWIDEAGLAMLRPGNVRCFVQPEPTGDFAIPLYRAPVETLTVPAGGPE